MFSYIINTRGLIVHLIWSKEDGWRRYDIGDQINFPCFCTFKCITVFPSKWKQIRRQTMTHQISLEDKLHKDPYLLEKMIWLRGCSDHPSLYQKEPSSALVEAGQLLGNWGQRETLEHPLWSTTNKRVRRRNYSCTEAHRNSAVYDWPNLNKIHKQETARTNVRKRKIQEFTLWQENKLYGPQSRWKTFSSLREDRNFSIFHLCCYCSVNRNLMGRRDLPARHKYAICKEQLKKIWMDFWKYLF